MFEKLSFLLEKIPARVVLYFLSWSGFLVSFMMRNDINFALVAMVGSKNAAGGTVDSALFSNDSINSTAFREAEASEVGGGT